MSNNKRKIQMLIIDAQNDFCNPKGSLFVAGADQDVQRLANFINRNGNRFGKINSTLDCHSSVHIAHGIFWVNSKGEHPTPFTVISSNDVRNGVWRCFNPKWQPRAQAYVDSLAKNGRYLLCIWPAHCLIGSWGNSVVPEVHSALTNWETKTFNRVNWCTKGSNFMTEHYSGLIADVPDNNDPTTKLDTGLLDILSDADEIVLAGEALSHCVASTVRDIVKEFGNDNAKKFTLLKDCSSSVNGFEKLGQDFISDMSKLGMRLSNSIDW